MIFIPKKEDCVTWNQVEDGTVYILYKYFEDYKNVILIQFIWYPQPVFDNASDKITKYEQKFDPNYLVVKGCMNEHVLKCPLNACNQHPQLRYNKLINLWYCTCSSSTVCTKNTDEDEMETFLKIYEDNGYSDKNGFAENPIEAIFLWNKNVANDYIETAKDKLKIIRKLFK